MKKTMISVCVLLFVGATSMMTAGAQAAPTLAVFVVGMDNTLGNALATQIGAELNRNSRYTVATNDAAVQAKLTELRAQGAGNIDRNALAAWGRTNGVFTICLVTDDIKGSDHMFSAHLIDAKESKVSGRGSYIRTGVGSGELPRVSLALAKQLDGPGRRHVASTSVQRHHGEPEMVFVKGGTFTMGCKWGSDGTCGKYGETPAHEVRLDNFYIGKYEVTQAQWKAVMDSIPSGIPDSYLDDEKPIANITYDEMIEYLAKLNTLTGKNYRMPREAEWEYAARGCNAGACESFTYSGSNNLEEVSTRGVIQPVGSSSPNGLGIYDMSGNAWERCSDYYSYGFYANSPVDNPENTTYTADGRITRSGSSIDNASTCRVSNRAYDRPHQIYIHYGFRVVLPAQ
jgi:formylglycine-generating enzyme required for sulfatase activity